jgi:vancomycin resistance protein YoaR
MVTVRAGDQTTEISPVDAGLKIDLPATVDRAMGGSPWNPVRVVRSVLGGGAVDPVVAFDNGALVRTVGALAESLDVPPTDGAISFNDGQIVRTEPVVGVEIDRPAAAQALRHGWPDADGSPIDLPVQQTPPAIDAADVDRAIDAFAEPAMSGPVTLEAGSTTVTLSPAEISPYLTMAADSAGTLEPHFDADALIAAQADVLAPLVKAPKNASFTFADDRPVVVPSEPGTALDSATLSTDLVSALTKTGSARAATATVATAEPDLTTEEAQALGVTEQISEFTTHYPIAPYRITNIGRAAELINGSLVLPGATWSLNGTVGERTAENGFVKGTIIEGGQFREDFGGGVSQVATTTFNAMFFAGLQDVEHKPHSFYISRYPAGREATVAWPTVDLKFRNDTSTGVVIQTIATPGTLTVRFWGTKAYDEVRSVSSSRTNITHGTTVHESGEDCVPQDPVDGFDITVTREFVRSGAVIRTEDFHTHYNPADRVICG